VRRLRVAQKNDPNKASVEINDVINEVPPMHVKEKAMFSTRDLLGTAAAGVAMSTTAAAAGSFGNPDEPPQGAINAKNPAGLLRTTA
jgi:hypothetical protein